MVRDVSVLALETLLVLVLVPVPSLSEPTEERVAVEVSVELEPSSLFFRLNERLGRLLYKNELVESAMFEDAVTLERPLNDERKIEKLFGMEKKTKSQGDMADRKCQPEFQRQRGKGRALQGPRVQRACARPLCRFARQRDWIGKCAQRLKGKSGVDKSVGGVSGL